MATKINFEKGKDGWEAKFTSSGNTVVELEREKKGLVSVLANISGMRAVPIAVYNNGYSADAIIRINVPTGIEVMVRSETEVTSANMLIGE